MPKQNRYNAADEHDFVRAGYVVFFDPPLQHAAEVLKSLRRDGVAVEILTGDNKRACSRRAQSRGWKGQRDGKSQALKSP